MKKKIHLSDNAKHFLRFVPNLLTICNSLCGFLAILYTLQVYKMPPSADLRGVFCISSIILRTQGQAGASQDSALGERKPDLSP